MEPNALLGYTDKIVIVSSLALDKEDPIDTLHFINNCRQIVPLIPHFMKIHEKQNCINYDLNMRLMLFA